ncbi:hypothetical protein FA95DRAFT_1556856 [Auriscalpium vulgare]|uniref:Uncharacterized protein n=1 Tax=Auriscalpium vulgare TaxID=40419 RepID=A0ACB8RZM0_9AGAM|nr:hypothetical protein FA95DRAFT_1556856 [Auriscalpium vulgare]
MGSVCLSLVPILRCIGLSQTEEKILLVPPALEVVFSLGLMVAGRGVGRSRFILAADGPFYFLLVLLEYLSHVVPLFQTSLGAFKGLDIFIGALSWLPIFFFSSYLYLYMRKEINPNLPGRFTVIAAAFGLAVIPCIVAANEVGSFVGIQYFLVAPVTGGPVQMAISQGDSGPQFVRSFFGSIALALFVLYEATSFFAFFMRLVSAFAKQNRIESTADDTHTVLFKGTGWISVGIKLCAIESVIGFASASFGVVFTRRVLRLLGRACIIIGVVKGPDRKESFDLLNGEKGYGSRALSTRRINISGPNLVSSSMAQRMSRMLSIHTDVPIATFGVPARNMLASPESKMISPTETLRSTVPTVDQRMSRYQPFELPETRPPMPSLQPGTQHPYAAQEQDRTQGRLVTVARTHGRAPTLILRLSSSGFPSPSTMAASVTGHSPTSPTSVYSVRDTRTFPLTAPSSPTEPLPALPSRRARPLSASSLTSDSRVRELSARFTGLPPRVTGKARGSILGMPMLQDDPDPRGAALRRDDSGRIGAELLRGYSERSDTSTTRGTRSLSRGGSSKRKPPPAIRASMLPDALATGDSRLGMGAGAGADPSSVVYSPTNRPTSGQWVADARRASKPVAPVIDAQGFRRGRRSQRSGHSSAGVFNIDWIANPPLPEEAITVALGQGQGRIKSVGHAPRRRTPTPSLHSAFTRASVAPEEVVEFPVNAAQRVSAEAVEARLMLTRQDSEVLSFEEAEMMRRRAGLASPV